MNIFLFICLFLSGAAGLVYEVVWAKYLSLLFGHTAYAHTLVLATFMGGLALGSYLIGRAADRIHDRLALYAWLEIGIAVLAILTPKLFYISQDIYLPLVYRFSPDGTGVLPIKFVLAAMIMLPPTLLMGGTLPVLGKFMIRALAGRGKIIARLYALNSLGAVAGTILAGFYLVAVFGLDLSVTLAAGVNFLVGFAVLCFAKIRRTRSSSPDVPLKEEAGARPLPDQKEETYSSTVVWVSLAAIFLSGFVSMLYEVVWIRLLSLVLGSSTYSFSLMLASFIFGITLGSFLISKIMPRSGRAFVFFGLCEICVALALLLMLPLYGKLPFLFLRFSVVLSRTPDTFVFYSIIKFLLAFLVMLPPTIFLGMTFPLASRIASRKMSLVGSQIGGVLAFNTAGNIMGALMAGLILIPAWGLQRVLEFGVWINLGLGLGILFLSRAYGWKKSAAAAGVCLLAVSIYHAASPEWNKQYFVGQVFRFSGLWKNARQFSEDQKRKEILFYKDGLNTTVAVTRSENDLSLFVNGKADASTHKVGDMATQILSGQLPLLLKPDARDVLVVGLGSGVTCGSALLHPIRRLDLVEISETLVEANHLFGDYNYHALKNPRLNLHVEDAKTFLQRTGQTYDLIISEPSSPWISGVGSLFSVEFFKDCLRHLNQGGLVVQWVNGYEMDGDTFEMIVRTFQDAFPVVQAWNPGGYDILLVGSNAEIVPNLDACRTRFAQEDIQADLKRVDLKDLSTLFSLQIASSGRVRQWVNEKGPVNSDTFPVLEYTAPLHLYLRSNIAPAVYDLDERPVTPERSGLIITSYIERYGLSGENMADLYAYTLQHKGYHVRLLPAIVRRWHAEHPQDARSVLAYAAHDIGGALDNRVRILENLAAQDPKTEYVERYAAALMQRYRALQSFLNPALFSKTEEALKECLDRTGGAAARIYHALGDLYFMNHQYEQAVSHYSQADARVVAMGKTDGMREERLKLFTKLGASYLRLKDRDSWNAIHDKLQGLTKE